MSGGGAQPDVQMAEGATYDQAAGELPGFIWLILAALLGLSVLGGGLWGAWLASPAASQLGEAIWRFLCP